MKRLISVVAANVLLFVIAFTTALSPAQEAVGPRCQTAACFECCRCLCGTDEVCYNGCIHDSESSCQEAGGGGPQPVCTVNP